MCPLHALVWTAHPVSARVALITARNMHERTDRQHQLSTIKDFNPHLQAAENLFNQAIIQVEEACDELQRYLKKLDIDPERLQWLETRLSKTFDLARKNRVSPEKLYAHHQQMRQEIQ